MANQEKPEKPPKNTLKPPPKHAGFWQVFWYKFSLWGVRTKFWKRFAIGLLVFALLAVGSMYGIARWYIDKHSDEPLVVGATFIPDYARYLEVDPQETLDALINDLGVKHFRLVSYWKNHEPQEGQYNFDELDWQFDMIEQAGGTVSLAIGLRQPRWPECHGPEWAMIKTMPEWKQDLLDFMGQTISRYKHRESLVSYQLENEYFLNVFGHCPDHSRERLVEEFDYVKSIDPVTPLIVSRSNNATPSWPVGEPRADMVAASIYKRVWDKTITNRYFEYPVPAWFYAFLAGATELTTDRNTFIHELQAESWLPENHSMRTTSLEDLYESMNPDMLTDRIEYAKATGMRAFDLWGVEWWYQMKTARNAPELWDTAKEEIRKIEQENQRLEETN